MILDADSYEFEMEKAIVLREGKDLTIFATGLEVYESLMAAEKLAEEGIDAEVINVHTLKPIDEETICASLAKTGKGVTVEEHSIIGGLFSAVSEVAAKRCPTKILPIGIEDEFGQSGPAKELLKLYKLDADGIYEKIKQFL